LLLKLEFIYLFYFFASVPARQPENDLAEMKYDRALLSRARGYVVDVWVFDDHFDKAKQVEVRERYHHIIL